MWSRGKNVIPKKSDHIEGMILESRASFSQCLACGVYRPLWMAFAYGHETLSAETICVGVTVASAGRIRVR